MVAYANRKYEERVKELQVEKEEKLGREPHAEGGGGHGIGCALKNSHITSVAFTACDVIAFGITGEPGQECP